MRLGRAEILAAMVVDGLAKKRRRIVYPRIVRPIYTFPGLVRTMSPKRVAKVFDQIDRDDVRVRRSGSMGDDLAPKREPRGSTANAT